MDEDLRKLERELGSDHPRYVRMLKRAGMCITCRGTAILESSDDQPPCPECDREMYELFYRQHLSLVTYDWDAGGDGIEGLEAGWFDVTNDPRWFGFYEGNGYHVAIIQDPCGYYWDIGWTGEDSWAENNPKVFLGSEADVIDKIGKPCQGYRCEVKLPWEGENLCTRCYGLAHGFTDLDLAREVHADEGGYLLHIGMPGSCNCIGGHRSCVAGCQDNTYIVTDDEDWAAELRADQDQHGGHAYLASLAPSFDETKRDMRDDSAYESNPLHITDKMRYYRNLWT